MEYILSRFWQNKCLYCKQELNREGWHSSWGSSMGHHYKSTRCEWCRRKNWARVNYPGSGHDAVFKQYLPSLESTVRKVMEK